MTKRIFHAILLGSLAVFLACLLLIFGVLYGYYGGVQRASLRREAELAAQGVTRGGEAYFEGLKAAGCRITWVSADGTVLRDTESDPALMENHANREEIAAALANGFGESARNSDTLTKRMVYYALRLPDGSVVRVSSEQSTALNLVLGMAQPMCMVLACALLLALLLARRLSRRIVAPLNRLDLEKPLENDGYDELSPLLRRIDSQQRQIRAAAANLRRRQQEFAAVTGNLREGLVLLGAERTILSINPAAVRLLGAEESCVGADFLTVNRSEPIRSALDAAYRGETGEGTLTLDGRIYHVDAGPVRADGAVTGVAVLLVDVTERIEAERMRREFTANVSHELKTPLHAISGYAELLANGIAKPEDTQRFAAAIYADAQRMTQLVQDILMLSELDEGKAGSRMESVDLYALAEQTVQALAPAAEKAQVRMTLTGEKAMLQGDPVLLQGIVRNLCDNAVKYNRPGGSVRICVKPEDTLVRLTVADTGIGIPPESRERVFERFYRVDKSRSRANGGTGLGLSIVKHTVQLYGGKLRMESTPGSGTEMEVCLPRSEE